MTTIRRLAASPGRGLILSLALTFFATCTWASYARWANFEYRTFDLAFYVQGLWQFIHGRYQVSVTGVPLLGNHVEPIVFLIAPLFLLFHHPLVLVAIQNAALASMGPVAFDIGRQLGLDQKTALLLGGAVLITPAAGYVALHEFHPEALTAPFLFLMLLARVRCSLRAHWCWLIAVLSCKENMALLIAAYCAVQVVLQRKRPPAELRSWYLWPMALSVFWFVVCVKFITPALNSGSVDYLALYDRLGASWGDIVLNAITQPQRILGALFQSLSHGNLLWALLLPFLALPLLRPRWLLIAAPILLQHLVSWRSSEWTIYFHYAAPLLPLFWIGLAEGVATIDRWSFVPVSIRNSIPFLIIAACIAAQIFLGPTRGIVDTTANWFSGKETRLRKQAFISQIPPDASILAPLPYLSHLATREKLYSLHYVLKGLKTLSRATYSPPPPTDFVLIDYNDSATFDPAAGYYHPPMKTVDGRVIPSSDRLLHEFLQRSSWTVRASDELTLLQEKSAGELLPATPTSGVIREIATGTTLTSITKSANELSGRAVEIRMIWNFQEPRDVFPWMYLKLVPRDHRNAIIISRGLCAPEATNEPYQENWRITPSRQIPEGDYEVEVLFIDNVWHAWTPRSGQVDALSPLLSPPVPLGELRVSTGKSEASRN